MRFFDSRACITVVIGLFAAIAIGAAGVGYVERSSDAAWTEFMRAADVSASVPDQAKAEGKTGCPVGRRELPTRLIPLR